MPAFLPALVIVFGLQELRVFFPSLAWYLKDTVGLSSLQLAPIAFGTVATVFLVPLFARRYGWHRLWQGAAVGLAVVRVAEQMVTIPAADFVLSATGVVLFLTACAAFLSLRLRGRVLSFFLGCTLDTAIRGFAGTLDLSWYDTWWAIIAVFVLAAAVVAVIARSEATRQSPATHDAGRSPRPSGARDDIAVLAIGPFLFLQMLIFQNFGWIAETFHLTPSGSFFAIMVGNAAVIALTSFCGTPLREFLEHRSHAAAEGTSPPGVEATGEAQGRHARRAEGRADRRPTMFFGVSMLLFVAMVFIYYASFDLRLLPISRKPAPSFSSQATTATASPITFPIRVMTYNIHSAYNVAGRQDPEAIAKVIEASGADIVGLQEVSRGWIIDGATDLVAWFAERLKMHVVFKGTADRVLGNAILSRYPIRAWGAEPLPSDDILLPRGFIWATLDIGDGESLLVIDTHLHHLRADHTPRAKQMRTLLDFWAKRPRTIIMGDMNAEPGEPAIALLIQAGLIDAWGATGQKQATTFRAKSPTHRIDWIVHTPDLRATNVDILDSTASDHFPVIAQLQLAE